MLVDTAAPHAFLPYMGARPHGLVLNRTRATCTNAVHRVMLTGVERRIEACASTWTSLFNIQDELLGRHYGGGIFKVEPGVAQSLPVLIGGLNEADVYEAVAEFAAGRADAGRSRLDRLLLQGLFGISDGELDQMRQAADRLARWRAPSPRYKIEPKD